MSANNPLRTIRALLAKAEATPYEAEAEAFTAKAQELIARHRIDRALLDHEDEAHRNSPLARCVDLDNPYLRAKVILLSEIAHANDCRSIWLKPRPRVELFGFVDDLDAVEELFTSLLVQATSALQRAGSQHDAYGRSRTRAYRRAFLLAFAGRIGQRLRETVKVTVDAAIAESGTALVPILDARVDAVKRLAATTHPVTRSMRDTASDADGWHAGKAFADQADLSNRRGVGSRA